MPLQRTPFAGRLNWGECGMEGFAHRANDRTFDSICKRCFRTVATRDLESELEQDEKKHVCRRQDLAWIEQLGGGGEDDDHSDFAR
ncbi:MAG TPA: hypothetical protein VG714_00250 [Acidobacteriaceae bacterium]|nr:hypothetical protein [Acidobacteriaceae bacterium]